MGKASDKILIRGPIEGYCNICISHGKLTRDHVPPKGCTRICEVELRSLLAHYSESTYKPELSQSGLNFRTICEHCNNDLLGKEYDPNLIDFANTIGRFLKAEKEYNLYIPNETEITIKPQRVARAVVGHLLAFTNPQNLNKQPPNTPYHDALREYFLNPHSPLPDRLNIYCWVYPANTQVIIDFHAVAIGLFKHTIMGSLLKFFPLGFWAVWDKPNDVSINTPLLLENKHLGINDEIKFTIPFRGIPRIQWPETPDTNGAVLATTGHSVFATERIKNRKKNKMHLPR